jgi:hypothetical protein
MLGTVLRDEDSDGDSDCTQEFSVEERVAREQNLILTKGFGGDSRVVNISKNGLS